MNKDNIIKIIMLVAFLVVLIIVAILLSYYKIEFFEDHSFYQYFSGKKVEYEGSFRLTNRNEITELRFKDLKVTLDSTPLYYKDVKSRVLLPKDMAIVYPLQTVKLYKLSYFTNVYSDGYDTYIEREKKQKSVQNAFLYDGNDLYFFLEDTTIVIDSQEYKVPALSYAIVEYNKNIELYNYEEDNCQIIETPNQEVIAKTDNYTISLSIDSVVSDRGNQLLIKKIESLNNFDYEGGD